MKLPLSSIRNQAAFARAVVGEVERLAPHDADGAVSAQLGEELSRLGRRFLEASSDSAVPPLCLNDHERRQP